VIDSIYIGDEVRLRPDALHNPDRPSPVGVVREIQYHPPKLADARVEWYGGNPLVWNPIDTLERAS
jgi:hypothetical protein